MDAAAGWIEKKSNKYEFLAAFAAGRLFYYFTGTIEKAKQQKIQETVLPLFTFSIFILFSTVLLLEQWLALG